MEIRDKIRSLDTFDNSCASYIYEICNARPEISNQLSIFLNHSILYFDRRKKQTS